MTQGCRIRKVKFKDGRADLTILEPSKRNLIDVVNLGWAEVTITVFQPSGDCRDLQRATSYYACAAAMDKLMFGYADQ